jgi:hypothetical protein
VLHYSDLSDTDVQSGPGYRYTKPLRAILDLIEEGTVEKDFLRQSLLQAFDRGLISSSQIRSVQTSEAVRAFLDQTLKRGQ